MKVGDLAYDNASGCIVMIVAINPTWMSTTARIPGMMRWDYEVIANGVKYYADADEISLICKTQEEK